MNPGKLNALLDQIQSAKKKASYGQNPRLRVGYIEEDIRYHLADQVMVFTSDSDGFVDYALFKNLKSDQIPISDRGWPKIDGSPMTDVDPGWIETGQYREEIEHFFKNLIPRRFSGFFVEFSGCSIHGSGRGVSGRS
jgi:hypothetical protein